MELWIRYSILCILLLSIESILMKIYGRGKNIDMMNVVLNIFIYVSIIIFIYFIKIKKTPMRLGRKEKQIMLLIASLYIIYYSIKIKLYNKAPNTGYGTIMIYSDVVTLSLLSYVLFSSHLNMKSVLSIITVIIGLLIIIMNQ